MIVKVQLSLQSTEPGGRQVLVYTEDQSVFGQFPAPDEVIEAMDGKDKAFFHAHIDDTGMIVLDNEAPWQEW